MKATKRPHRPLTHFSKDISIFVSLCVHFFCGDLLLAHKPSYVLYNVLFNLCMVAKIHDVKKILGYVFLGLKCIIFNLDDLKMTRAS